MMNSNAYFFILLLFSIALIIWLTAVKKLNAFFALMIAALGVGILSGIPPDSVANALKKGFGSTMEKIGLLIILGTSLGIILEKTGATLSMANAVLKIVRDKFAPAAICITGFIIGLPLFCDSGFIILSGLNHSLVQKTKFSMPVMAAALATGLYSVHCLVPPHPGITAAVGTVSGDIGIVMLLGIGLAIPAAIAGFLWVYKRGRNVPDMVNKEVEEQVNRDLPSATLSFLPVILPIFLIALKSIILLFYTKEEVEAGMLIRIISFLGDPVIAFGVAILVSLILVKKKTQVSGWLSEAVDRAGMILAVTGAGGMFGEMLQASGLGTRLGNMLGNLSLGIFLPFIITAILKTAQGSSTVAIITAASILSPLLPGLHLDSGFALTLTILSMGAGSMMVSHANDSYFWVITRFSNIDPSVTLKVYSTATIVMGITVQLIIWGLLNFI